MNPMDLPNGISPREELESRVIAMLLGEADEFEKTELEALLSKDSSLQAFHDEMARSIDVVGEAAVSIGPVGAPDAPKLHPTRRQEIEQAWSGGGTASGKTATTMAGSLAKMHPLIPLAVAAGVGLAAGTALVNFNNEDSPDTNRVEAPANLSDSPSSTTGKETIHDLESAEVSENLARRSVFDIPEGTARGPFDDELGAEAPNGAALDRELLENELRNLSANPPSEDVFTEAERRASHLELARRNGDFSFDSEGVSGDSRGNPIGSGSGHPGVFAFGPPNAIALGDLGKVAPVPNASAGLSTGNFGKDSFHPSVTGFSGEIGLPESNPKSSAVTASDVAETANPIPFSPPATKIETKRELLARHVVLASYTGSPFHACRGRTGRCPANCGGSGEFATFAIEKYLEYEKPGKYGSAKQSSHLIQISDFHRKPIGDPEQRQVIMGLKEGDHVLLSWSHDYVTSNGSSSPDRPVKELRRLTKAEEKAHFPR